MQLLFLDRLFSNEMLNALGWTLFHSLWIGLLAAALAGFIILFTRKSSARLRYNLLLLVLCMFLSGIIVTYFMQRNNHTIANTETKTQVPDAVDSIISADYVTTATPARGFIENFTSYFNTNADLFVLIWAIFFVFHSIRLLTGLAGIHRI